LGQYPSADHPPKQKTKTEHGFLGRKLNKHGEKPLKDSFFKKQRKNKKTRQKDTFLAKNNKDKYTPQKDSFKSKREKRKSKTNDAFSVKTEAKNYGEKSTGKRIRKALWKKNKIKGKDVSSGSFTATNNHSMDYGEKASGKKLKFRKRKLEEKSVKGSDAFTTNVKRDKKSPLARKKGKNKNPNVGTGKKKKKYKLFRFRLKSKEERQMEKQNDKESADFSTTREMKKAMKKQKKKRDYGLGLPKK